MNRLYRANFGTAAAAQAVRVLDVSAIILSHGNAGLRADGQAAPTADAGFADLIACRDVCRLANDKAAALDMREIRDIEEFTRAFV